VSFSLHEIDLRHFAGFCNALIYTCLCQRLSVVEMKTLTIFGPPSFFILGFTGAVFGYFLENYGTRQVQAKRLTKLTKT